MSDSNEFLSGWDEYQNEDAHDREAQKTAYRDELKEQNEERDEDFRMDDLSIDEKVEEFMRGYDAAAANDEEE
jgi:hypothetical protein